MEISLWTNPKGWKSRRNSIVATIWFPHPPFP